MQLSKQNPEYQRLFTRAQQTPCTCKGVSKNLRDTAKNGCLKCCTKFIDQARGRDEEGWTALMLSAKHDHLEIARLLIPLEAKMQGMLGGTALMKSARWGCLEIAKLLIPHEAKMQDSHGETALMKSARWGCPEVAKLLLPIEGDITDKDGKAPAEYARYASPTIRALFSKPAPGQLMPQQAVPEIPKPAQVLPIPKPAQATCKCGGRAKTLLEAADQGCKDCAAKFISEAGKVVAGTTALIRAAEKGHVEIAQLLIQKEAKMRDSSGQAAIHKAAAAGHLEIVQRLMPHEAELRDANGRTALIHAVRASHVQIAKLLLRLEGSIADNNGKKAGDFASSASNPEIWSLFPGDVNGPFVGLLRQAHTSACICGGGSNSLRAAAIVGCLKCAASHLFETGTLTNGKTALMVAAVQGHAMVVALLVAREAGHQDAEGKTALAYAVQSGCADAIRLLLPYEEKFIDQKMVNGQFVAGNQFGTPAVTMRTTSYPQPANFVVDVKPSFAFGCQQPASKYQFNGDYYPGNVSSSGHWSNQKAK